MLAFLQSKVDVKQLNVESDCKPAASGADKPKTVASADGWSPNQQKQLEMALKTVAASDTQRWEKNRRRR